MQSIERRIEGRDGLPPAAALPPIPKIALESATPLVPMLGKALLVLAGAYLLRAVTGQGILPKLAGVFLALGYASSWLVVASRVREGAVVYSLTASAIAAPMLVETCLWLGILPATAAAAALALFCSLGLVLALRSGLMEIAWVTLAAGGITATVLIIGTRVMVPFAAGLIILAAITEAGAVFDRWPALRWVAALALDLNLLLMIYLLGLPSGLPEGYTPIPPASAAALLISFLAIYLAAGAWRTLGRGLEMTAFEFIQLAATLLLFVGGGLRIAGSNTTVSTALALFCLLAGLAAYWASLAAGRRRNFHCYSVFALALVASGTGMLFHPAWAGLAVAALWLGAPLGRATRRFHCAAYLALAATASGLLAHAGNVFFGGISGVQTGLSAAGYAAGLASALCFGLNVTLNRNEPEHWAEAIPSTVIAVLPWLTIAGLTAALAASPLDAAWAATVRTQILALTAVLLGWAGRRLQRAELRWLLYPWLSLTVVKLLLEDFRFGRPESQFVSLLFLGGAFLLLPRRPMEAKLLAESERTDPWRKSEEH